MNASIDFKREFVPVPRPKAGARARARARFNNAMEIVPSMEKKEPLECH